MYKIIAYNVREEEVEIVNKWSKDNNVEVEIVSEPMTEKNIHLSKNFDGVTTAQLTKIPLEFYDILKSYGIKQIAQRSAGFDYYDLEVAKEKGIIISNVPVYSPESIAEYAVTAALNMIRKNDVIRERVSEKDFRWTPAIRGRLVNELTVGIIGTGNIGRKTAKIFKGFGAKVIGYDVFQNDEAKEYLEYKETIEEVVSNSDIISIHVPATKDNYHQFDYELFKKFKKDAVFVNAARGSVVCTEGLIKALDEGLIEAATLDTYENEAVFVPKDFRNKELGDELFEKILKHPKITFTPHIAYYTNVSVRNILHIALNSTLEVLETGTTKNRVN